MPNSNFVSRNSVLLIVLAVTIGVTAAGATATLWRPGTSSSGPPLSVPIAQTQVDLNTPRTLTLLPIRLRRLGFLPKEVATTAGNFEFLIINATGEPDITLNLQRERGGENLQKFNPKPGRNLRKQFYLGPGEYLLTVEEHPEWVCRLAITNP